MSDFRKFKPSQIENPQISEYSVLKDKRGGFRVELQWNYFNEKIIGFRVYKAELSRNLLQQEYKLTQRALEKLSQPTTKNSNSTLLYNKIFFTQNSKVKFFQEEKSKFDVEESENKKYDYFQVGFIRVNNKNEYLFLDKNIRFGKTYSYIITGVTRNLQETDKKNNIFVNIEDLTPPENIFNFTAEDKNTGILLLFQTNNSDVLRYHIFRRKNNEQKFTEIAILDDPKNINYFVDSDVVPGNEYSYRIYPVDYYENLSWYSPTKTVEFKSIILNKGAIQDPLVEITTDNDIFLLKGYKNNKKIVGYRIERRDLWKYDYKFEIKSHNSIPLPNVIFFDEDGKIEIRDEGVYKNRAYQYRVSSISSLGKIESIFISPTIEVLDNLYITNLTKNLTEQESIKFIDFDAEINNLKENPLYCKFTWSITGEWDTLKIVINDIDEVYVHNLHQYIFYNKFEKNKKYKIRANVYKIDEFIPSDSREIIIST